MKRREIFIELTSLLDVILIMLFILLTQAKNSTAQALDTAALAESNAQQLETKLSEAYDEQEALRAAADAQTERADALERQLWTENLVVDNSLLSPSAWTGPAPSASNRRGRGCPWSPTTGRTTPTPGTG